MERKKKKKILSSRKSDLKNVEYVHLAQDSTRVPVFAIKEEAN